MSTARNKSPLRANSEVHRTQVCGLAGLPLQSSTLSFRRPGLQDARNQATSAQTSGQRRHPWECRFEGLRARRCSG
eukprot:11021094-Alexandrium_andersonii.AAC.1